MKASALLLLVSCLMSSAVDAAAISDNTQHARYNTFSSHETRDTSDAHDLWKRKGGGRSGGGVGSSSSKPGTSGVSGGRGASTSPTSNLGGTSLSGSGPRPRFGGGAVYTGGSRTPYNSGTRWGTMIPFLVVAGVALAFWPFHYPHGAQMYPYGSPYSYYNASSQRNETREVLCGCREYEVCSCDDEDEVALKALIGDGSYDSLNKSIVDVGDVNGTQKILIDGSLPNGTTAEDPSLSSAMNLVGYHAGWWPVVATTVAMVIWV